MRRQGEGQVIPPAPKWKASAVIIGQAVRSRAQISYSVQPLALDLQMAAVIRAAASKACSWKYWIGVSFHDAAQDGRLGTEDFR